MKVLVIEDYIDLNKNICTMLNLEGFIPFSAFEYNTALSIYTKEKPDLILLDIMLPGGNGYDLIPIFRTIAYPRIIMITALNDTESRAVCYEKGADDYITKPLDLNELKYKLHAIKRQLLFTLDVFIMGDVSVNTLTHEISCKNNTLILQPSQITLLKLLYEKYLKGDYLHKSEIIPFTNSSIDESQRIRTLIARTRQKLTLVGSQSVWIEPIYGQGYELIIN